MAARKLSVTPDYSGSVLAMPGHWEGDLIKGKEVGTLMKRTSGYLMLIRMNDATAKLEGGLRRALLPGEPIQCSLLTRIRPTFPMVSECR